MSDAAAQRRAFVLAETKALGAFLGGDAVAGWHRSYTCECGFRCNAPQDIFDHSLMCSASVRTDMSRVDSKSKDASEMHRQLAFWCGP